MLSQSLFRQHGSLRANGAGAASVWRSSTGGALECAALAPAACSPPRTGSRRKASPRHALQSPSCPAESCSQVEAAFMPWSIHSALHTRWRSLYSSYLRLTIVVGKEEQYSKILSQKHCIRIMGFHEYDSSKYPALCPRAHL